MKNKIEDLRNHLFATLEALQDEEKPMDLDRAKVIAEVAQTVINSAKVEVDFAKVTGINWLVGFCRSSKSRRVVRHIATLWRGRSHESRNDFRRNRPKDDVHVHVRPRVSQERQVPQELQEPVHRCHRQNAVARGGARSPAR